MNYTKLVKRFAFFYLQTTVMSSFVQLDKLSRVPSHFFSTHRILFISNEQMISSLRPQVHTILSQLMKECLNTVTNGSNRLIELTRQHIEVNSTKYIICTCQVYYLLLRCSLVNDMILKDSQSLHRRYTEFTSIVKLSSLNCLTLPKPCRLSLAAALV